VLSFAFVVQMLQIIFICCFSNKESFDGRLFGHVLISWGMRLPSVFPFGINWYFAVLSKNVRMKIERFWKGLEKGD
jgi:hypothetical protein